MDDTKATLGWEKRCRCITDVVIELDVFVGELEFLGFDLLHQNLSHTSFESFPTLPSGPPTTTLLPIGLAVLAFVGHCS